MSQALRIRLNGEDAEVPRGTTVGRLVEQSARSRARVAVERNREVVPRRAWDETPVEEGDVIEVVTLVGGG